MTGESRRGASGVRHAFMLGKFMPPHAGHLYAARVGARLAHTMTVLVCSTDHEPIDGTLRAGWMRELLPECRVVHMHRDIPQVPEDHPDFWPIWRAAVREHHPETIDRVLGSETYVFRLAQELEATAVLLDPERQVFDVSATQIRAAPGNHWQFLSEPVRAWYRRRVCLLGPESTGKSSLAAHLAHAFDTCRMPEYGRTYDAHYRQGGNWREADFIALASTHAAMRAALEPRAGPLWFEDTDALQTLVWADFLGAPMTLDALLPEFVPADFYLLLSPEVSWHDDGTRYLAEPASRTRFFARCEALLQATGHPYAVVEGSRWAERERAARDIVERVSGLSPTPG